MNTKFISNRNCHSGNTFKIHGFRCVFKSFCYGIFTIFPNSLVLGWEDRKNRKSNHPAFDILNILPKFSCMRRKLVFHFLQSMQYSPWDFPPRLKEDRQATQHVNYKTFEHIYCFISQFEAIILFAITVTASAKL